MNEDHELTEIKIYTPRDVRNDKTCDRKLKKYVKKYCESSSIQGLNYLIQDISAWERLWWILVLVVCLVGCFYMIGEIYQKWEQTPVIVTFATKETPVRDIPFPAVTICPESKITTSYFNHTEVLHKLMNGEEVTETERKEFNYMNLVCELDYNELNVTKPDNSIKYNASEVYDFFYKQRVSKEDLMLAYWASNDSIGNLSPIMTDSGVCYTFNMLDREEIFQDNVIHYDDFLRKPKSNWHIETGYENLSSKYVYPQRTFSVGSSNSFMFLQFTHQDQQIYSCNILDFQGFRVSLHLPTRLPLTSEDFFSVSLNKNVIVTVEPEMVTTSDKIKSYDPEKRGCYFIGEKKLKYFKYYSQINCLIECKTNYTLDMCGCVDLYMPRTSEDTLICAPSECLENARKLGSEENASATDDVCDCKPSCADITYNYRLSLSDTNFKMNAKALNNPLFEFLAESGDMSSVVIFFKAKQFMTLRKDELYGVSDFISNFGGLLGLFTGFSLFSVAEIIYFLSVRIIENRRKYKDWSGPDE